LEDEGVEGFDVGFLEGGERAEGFEGFYTADGAWEIEERIG